MQFLCTKISRVVVTLSVVSVLVGAVQGAHSQTTIVLYNFCSQPDCADGNTPNGPLIIDKKGNLYGTTSSGGVLNQGESAGTVFEVSPSGNEVVLFSFNTSDCAGGCIPQTGPFMDKLGNLYGTTFAGGNGVCGTGGYCGGVYQLSTSGIETMLYSFCHECATGSWTQTGVVVDSKGDIYGTSPYGGAYDGGTVYKVDLSGNESVVHSFNVNNPPGGQNPDGGLLLGKGGLYGTTNVGGANGFGVVFKMSKKGKEKVLYSFNPANGVDGENPTSPLIMDKAGNLYGVNNGGAYGGGTVYKVTQDGVESVLYSFCSQPNCEDGAGPSGPLVMDKEGNLYGTTGIGGTGGNDLCGEGCGTVFSLTPNGIETVLFSFYCTQAAGCPAGAFPNGGLVMDKDGNVYGTTQLGGADIYSMSGLGGTVFKVTP